MIKKILMFLTVVVYSTTVFSFNKYEDFIVQNNPRVAPKEAKLIVDSVMTLSLESDLNPLWLLAIIKVESNYNNRAIRVNNDRFNSKDLGLSQINSYWWFRNWHDDNIYKVGIVKYYEEIFEIYKNIECMIHVLKVKRRICTNRISNGTTDLDLGTCMVASYNAVDNYDYYSKVREVALYLIKMNENVLSLSSINTDITGSNGYRFGVMVLSKASRGELASIKAQL